MLKLGLVTGCVCAATVLGQSPSLAAVVQWGTASGGNGHYYEYIFEENISWHDAEAAAAARSHNGLQGYLATITSAAEQAFILTITNKGWIGASDEAEEGVWKWVTGPEAGQQFWQGNQTGGTTLPFSYANWTSPSEPNNFQGNNENYAHLRGDAAGTWNDYTATGRFTAFTGYIVEYSGSENPAAIPTPALLPGLIGMGAAALRKRKQEAKADA